jgi:hypothetical protein
MAESRSQGSARVLAHDYLYAVSDEWIDAQIDETGVEPPKVWRIKFHLRELATADDRKRARRLRREWAEIPLQIILPEPAADPDEFLDLLETWLEEDEDRLSEDGAETEEMRRRRRLASFDADMAKWIASFGSNRLKLASARNYKITSSYAKERGREELPECWVDTSAKAQFRERVDPSMQALKVETNFRGWLKSKELDLDTRIIWLTTPPPAMAEYMDYGGGDVFEEQPEFAQQEALLIPTYLGKYEAYLPVDREQRAPRADDPYWEVDDDEEDE